MASDRLVFEVIAEGKNLKVVQRDADKLAGSVERTDRARKKSGKGQNAYNKREKAIHQSNLSSAKGFSKLNQTMGGSSGLVGAYATLAANVFAATAAFNALAGAARFEQLAAGLSAVGAAAGRNLSFASQKLVEVSGNAISTEQAMRSMALGISSGFSTEQMEGLTKVAKGASLALGRDMADAMDRLVRGAAKLEPEILDELGIMVRLDDATENYAAKLGKTEKQLSQFERRQAFLNAILEQGEAKFGALADSIDPTQYDKLAATLDNLSKTFLSIVNAGLKPLIDLLAGSQGVLLGVMILFAGTIAKQVLPALANLGKKTKETAKAETKAAGDRLKNQKITKKMPKDFVLAAKAMSKGTINQQLFDKALRSTSASMTRHSTGLKQIEVNNLSGIRAYAQKRITMFQVDHARQQLIRNMQVYLTQQARENAGNAIQLIGQGNLWKGIKMLGTAISEYTVKTRMATVSGSMFTKGMGLMRIGMFATASAAKGLGAAFMRMLGPLGLVITIGMMVWDVFKDHFLPTAQVAEDTQEIIDSLTSIHDVAKSFNETIRREGGLTASAILAGWKAVSGVLKELSSHIATIDKSASDSTGLGKLSTDLSIAKDRLETFNKVGEATRVVPGARGRLNIQKVDIDVFGQGEEEYKTQIAALEAKRKSAQEQMFAVRASETTRMLDKYYEIIASHPGLKQVGEEQFQIITELKERINTKTGDRALFEADIVKWQAEVGNAVQVLNNVIGVFAGASDAAMNLRKSMNAAGQKTTSPFDDVIRDAKIVEEKFKVFETNMAKLRDEGTLTAELYKEMYDALEEQMGTPAFKVKNAAKFVTHLETAKAVYVTTAAEVKELTNQHKLLNKVASSSGTLEAFKAQATAADNLLKRRIKGQEAELKGMYLMHANEDEAILFIAAQKDGRDALTKFLAKEGDLNDKIAKQIAERIQLLAQEKTVQQKTFEEEVARIETLKLQLDVRKKLVTAQKTQLNNAMKLHEAELQLEKARNTSKALRKGIDATPADQLRTFLKFSTLRQKQALSEFNLATKRIKLERALLTAKVILQKADLAKTLIEAKEEDVKGIEEAIASLDTIPDLMTEVFDAQINAAESTYELALKTLGVEEKKLELANLAALIGKSALSSDAFGKGGKGFINFSRNMTNAMDLANAKAQSNFVKQQFRDYQSGAGLGGGQFFKQDKHAWATARADLQEKLDSETFDFEANLTGLDKLTTVLGPMAEMFKSMSEMGGDSSNMIAALGGQMDQWGAISQTIGGGDDSAAAALAQMFGEDGPMGEMKELFDAEGPLVMGIKGMAAGLAIVAGIMATIYAIKTAGTADRIAAIDKEIAATKKLGDTTGRNAEKLMNLEKKKESLKKKQFKQNKKMMLAQAMMGIALGIIGAMALLPNVYLAIAMAAIVASVGAYQLAIIAGMSYQGGGAGGGGGGPKAVNIGERSNKVDVAGAKPAGEIAYLRGERGIGSSASNFSQRGAFVGARHRATGGAAYIVGEQGPELFVPEVPGQIVTNDNAEAMGAPINVSFQISAIDSTNMEDMLTTQRGNIISMIREAANSHGTSFLEGVDVSTYDVTVGENM